jgi:hypothetical protein
MTKRCTKCLKHKERNEFFPDKRAGDGLQSSCKQCGREEQRNKYHSDADWRKSRVQRHKSPIYKKRHAKREMQRYCRDRRRILLAHKEYSSRPGSRIKKSARNLRRCASFRNLRRIAMRNSSEIVAIERVYAKAHELRDRYGIAFQVDHVVPLTHPLVCGLHSHANLQLLDAPLNKAKRNYYWPDMPD